MKIKETVLEYQLEKGILEKGVSEKEVLFFDIETTGFSAKTTTLYMIGIGYKCGDKWHIRQYLAEKDVDEKELILSFLEFIKDYKMLIHFNGDGFDLPYVKKKSQKYNISIENLEHIRSFDIYKAVMPYRDIFPIQNLKQKSVEEFLGINREDEMDGGQLISVYQQYKEEHGISEETLLLCHNHDDIKGLIQIMPILFYRDVFHGMYQDSKLQFQSYSNKDGNTAYELNITLSYKNAIITPFSFHLQGVYFKISSDKLFISVKAEKAQLKYFFEDYKNYYYLPVEDMAVHKSVASYVDKKYRRQAVASNCYIKKEGIFLPAFSYKADNLFQYEYRDRQKFILYSEELLSDNHFIKSYLDSLFSLF